jgi:2-oxo-3-hexenedioate decarboxylase
MSELPLDQIAIDLLSVLGAAKVLPSVVEQYPGFSLDDGYAVAHRIRALREARGERAVGRKIGGTNPATYAQSGAKGPMWGFVYDSTVTTMPQGFGRYSLGSFRQPRLEPEVVLHIAVAPEAGMSERDIIACIDQVAFGYEIVHSPFADWKVAPADSIAAHGLHQALLLGQWLDITADRRAWVEKLRSLHVGIRDRDGEEHHGVGSNVLGSPLNALRTIVDDIARNPTWSPISAGEIVTTGTLTSLMPAAPGQRWSSVIEGSPLGGLDLELV